MSATETGAVTSATPTVEDPDEVHVACCVDQYRTLCNRIDPRGLCHPAEVPTTCQVCATLDDETWFCPHGCDCESLHNLDDES